MSSAYDKVKSVTAQMKSSIGLIYGIYAFSRYIGKINPRYFTHQFIETNSIKYTAGFSNTPGPLKPFRYEDKSTNEVMKVITSNAYVMLAGKVGFTLSALSNVDKISLAIVSDENVLSYEKNKQMVHSIHNYVSKEIEKFE